jgi:hypothetical protein
MLDRRQFLQLSAASMLAAEQTLNVAAVYPAKITSSDKTVRAEGKNYTWEWSQENDRFRLLDRKGRRIVSGSLQPAVIVRAPGDRAPRCSQGRFSSKSVSGNRVIISYEGVNKSASVTVAWRFDEDALWYEPVVYDTSAAEDVVSVHLFARANGEDANPSLDHTYLIQPGIIESSGISPVLLPATGLDLTSWLGHGGGGVSGIMQQWALPTHFFCGLTSEPGYNAKGSLKEHLSDAFCCGLSEFPSADLLFHMKGGMCTPVLGVRSDLWGQSRGPGRLTLGAPFLWAIGRDYREAIRQYYLGLVRAGVIRKKANSPAKNAAVTASQFNTWGAEVAIEKAWYKFDEPTLDSIYEGLKASGMKPGMFVIDAKWEGTYGLLEHSEARFPHFEQFLAHLRADGHKLGMWAAFMRCDDPAAVGLNTSHMLRDRDGKPITKREVDKDYYLLDFSQPEVQKVLSGLAKRFVKRYRPDLVKFDFGYELPSLSDGAPKDMAWAGERLLKKGLDVVVGAMREVNPDLVVMYYSLSPLFIDYFDLHSPDDMFACGEDYHLEANRRFFFSSLLGEIGMPTYGSGGYDWLTVRDIWFDSAPMGTLGSLNSFSGDEQDSGPTPDRVAKYNGLAQILRSSNTFTVEPLDPVLLGSSNGARSSSWVRLEDGEPVLVALRASRLDGNRGPERYKNIVRCSTSVVVASKTPEGIAKSGKLGIVPYGDGELSIRHEGATRIIAATTHRFGKPPVKRQLTMTGDVVRIPLTERLDDGSVVEWLEVDFS